MKNTVTVAMTFSDNHLDKPITGGVIMERDEQGVHTNVPHLVVHHSPDGFEFGYGGSGPADLALNICEVTLNRIGYKGRRVECFCGQCFDMAWQMHHEFKWEFVAPVPRAGGNIPYENIEAWVRRFLDESDRS